MDKKIKVTEGVVAKHSPDEIIKGMEEAKMSKETRGTTSNGIRFKIFKNIIILA